MTEAKQRDRMIFLINKKYQDTKIGSFWPLAWSENHFIFLVRVWVSRGLVGRGGGVVAGVSLIEDVRGEFLILSGNDEWRLVPVLTSPQTESKHDVTITRLKLSTPSNSLFPPSVRLHSSLGRFEVCHVIWLYLREIVRGGSLGVLGHKALLRNDNYSTSSLSSSTAHVTVLRAPLAGLGGQEPQAGPGGRLGGQEGEERGEECRGPDQHGDGDPTESSETESNCTTCGPQCCDPTLTSGKWPAATGRTLAGINANVSPQSSSTAAPLCSTKLPLCYGLYRTQFPQFFQKILDALKLKRTKIYNVSPVYILSHYTIERFRRYFLYETFWQGRIRSAYDWFHVLVLILPILYRYWILYCSKFHIFF